VGRHPVGSDPPVSEQIQRGVDDVVVELAAVEVLPIDTPSTPAKPGEYSLAYWAGWLDGRSGESGGCVDNPNLARWEDPSDRLAYYRGRRAGNEARHLIPKSTPLHPSGKG
jgi:hypothetical protein